MNSQFWLYAAAGFNVALALFHLAFWRLFQWKTELAKLHPTNRGVVQVLNVMLSFFFVFMAAMQLIWAHELPTIGPGRMLLAGMTLFWSVRAVLQFVFWRTLPLRINLVFGALFAIGAALHAQTLR